MGGLRLRWVLRLTGLLVGCILSQAAMAGNQQEEALADSVRVLLRQAISAQMPEVRPFRSAQEAAGFYRWREVMSERMSRYVASPQSRYAILNAVDYEARRAGLDPALVLGVVTVESRFQPQATSPVGARGLMQVMPFWARTIGDGHAQTLHHLRTNVRFGCVILRHYLDRENGNVVRALARYNGSLGQTHYPSLVLNAASYWR